MEKREALRAAYMVRTIRALRHNSPLIDFTTSVILTVKIVGRAGRAAEGADDTLVRAKHDALFQQHGHSLRNLHESWLSRTIWCMACSRCSVLCSLNVLLIRGWGTRTEVAQSDWTFDSLRRDGRRRVKKCFEINCVKFFKVSDK